MATIDIPENWVPTAEAINASPPRLRDYIHHLETEMDPQFTLQQLFEARAQISSLEAMLAKGGLDRD